MTTTSNQGDEFTKEILSFLEHMLKARDREAVIDKAVDHTMEIACRFGGENITNFPTMYRKEMQQRDVLDLK